MRFPGFGGEWEKYKVSDVLDFYSTNSLSWEQLDYDNEDLYNLHYGLIHVGLPILVDIKQNKLPGIKTDCKPKNFELCKEGDVAFADASEDTNDVAKAIEFINLNNQKAVCGLHTIHGRDNKGLTVPGYKGYTFASPLFHNQIRKIAQGTKIYSISSKNFAECYIGIPSKNEKTKIAKLLALIDTRISTQIKIIEKLESLIKGIYEKVYNIDEEKFLPLGNIVKIQKGEQINGEELSEQGAYYVMNGGIAPSGYFDSYNTLANTISISEGGNSCGYVQYNNVPFWSGGHCYTLTECKDSFNYKYLYHYLKYKELSIMALRIGSGLPNIQKKDLERFSILDICKEKQNKMVYMLDDLSTKISTERKILENYEEQKKYLLSNLFI